MSILFQTWGDRARGWLPFRFRARVSTLAAPRSIIPNVKEGKMGDPVERMRKFV